jgi:hypothetical protein
MKPILICLTLIVTTLLLLTVVLFFRDRVLFFLAGYDYVLIKSTSVEAFKAYAAIQKWRWALVGLTVLAGLSCAIVCRNTGKTDSTWYYTIGKFLGIITCIIMVVILCMYIVLPKRLL